MLIALLATVWTPLVLQDDLAKPITLDLGATRLERVVSEMAIKTGVPMKASAQASGDIVMVVVKSVPAEDVMKRLADITRCEWKRDPSGYVLQRNPVQMRAALAEDTAERLARIEKGLAEDRKALEKLQPWDAKLARTLADKYLARVKSAQSGGEGDRASFDTAMQQAPIPRASRQLLALIGAKALSEIQPNTRVVFSSSPNSMQRPLPAAAVTIARTAVKQQAMFSEQYRKIKPEDRQEYQFGSASPDLGSGKPELGIGKVLVVCNGSVYGPNISIMITDGQGDPLVQTWAAVPMELAKDVPAPSPASPFNIPAESTALAKAITATGSGSGAQGTSRVTMMASANGVPLTFESRNSPSETASLSLPLKVKVLHPAEYEPLDLMAGAALRQIAGDRNLIAFLPDSLFAGLAWTLAQDGSANTRLPVTLGRSLQFSVADSWVTVTPRAPHHSITNRANRPALAKLIQRLDEQSYVKLLDLCEFALAQQKSVEIGDMEAAYLALLNPSSAGRTVTMLKQPGTLRVFGSLSPNQRTTLINGGSLVVASLTQAQRDWLTNEVFVSWDGTQVQNRQYHGNSSEHGGELERTEILPKGILANTTLTLSVFLEDGFIATGPQGSSVVTASELAQGAYQNERTDLGNVGQAPTYERYTPAKQATYAFEMNLAPKYNYGRLAYDVWVEPNAKPVGYEQLPKRFRDEIENLLGLMRKAFGRIENGRFVPPL